MISQQPCACGSHSQHRLYRYLFENPGAPLKAAARELGMTYNAVKIAHFRLKPRNLSRLCPYCFQEALEGLVCRRCGAELDAPLLLSTEGMTTQETVHVIQPGAGLGSKTNYNGLHFQYGALNVKHLAEHPDDSLLERAKSKLWEELKGPMFEDRVVEEATRLLTKEVSQFRAKYPELVRARGVSSQLVSNVVALLRLRYPNRFEKASPMLAS